MITYGLTIPVDAESKASAVKVVKYLIEEEADLFDQHGFSMFKPRFYGPRDEYSPFDNLADYGGEF